MSETFNLIEIEKLERPIVAIVRLASENKEKRDLAGVVTPYYQVTVSKDHLSPTREFIRFGMIHGDEINGWRPVADIVIEEVIGQYKEGWNPPEQQSLKASHPVELVPFQRLKAVA